MSVSTPPPHCCDWQGCDAPGEYRAPKSHASIGSNRPEDFYRFCLDHVREYNKNWDFFSEMTEEQIFAFQKDAVIGHRPTWRREKVASGGMNREQQVHEAMNRLFGEAPAAARPAMPLKRLPKKILEALATLNLDSDAEFDQIRKRYKELVKQHHPDATGGDKRLEEQFKRITQAYDSLKKHFQE